jgi:lysophospholipase L1-like esterase
MIRNGLIALLALALNTAPGGPATQPTSRPATTDWAKHYYRRVEQFERENRESRKIVLVGSSHIEGFRQERLLPGRKIVNRGISSDRIGIGERGVLHRLDSSVFDCNPGIVFLENGVNDLGELWRHGTPSLDEIEACYRKVVRQIRERRPDVKLVIVGLFPTRDRFAGLGPLIVQFNARLEKIAADFNCPFMDVHAPFADEQGLLRRDLSRDGLHLNDAGYERWADMIDKALTQHGADRPTPTGSPASRPTR